jgi:hypothetical protein
MIQALIELHLQQQAGIGLRGQRQAGDLRPELKKPQRQPAALEARVPRKQHALSTPQISVEATMNTSTTVLNSPVKRSLRRALEAAV